jgi:hypothetical protein
MMIRPTEIFDRFQEFRLFNWTTPKTLPPFDNLYNAGVRYYAAAMDPELWHIGDALAENWVDDNWNMEQEIFNTMFWQQAVPDPHHPELNWQGMHMIRAAKNTQKAVEEWNGLPVSLAHVLHVHGSRDPMLTAKLMTNTVKQLGIELS